jgi:hypothetical protein
LFYSLIILFRRNLVFSQYHRLSLSQHFFLRFRYPVSLQPNLLLRSSPRSILPSFYSTPFYPPTSIDFRFPLSIAASTVLQSL